MGKPRTAVDVVVGQNIRMFRVQRGFTQQELGRRLGVALRQVQKYEDGVNRVSAGRLSEIARTLEVEVLALLEGSPVGASIGDDQLGRTLLASRHSVRLVQAFDGIRHEGTRVAMFELIEEIGRRARRRKRG